MKTLLLIVFIPCLVLAIVRSELTPWRLVSPTEYTANQSRLQSLEQQVKSLEQQVKQNAQRPRLSDGSWMTDEKYRTSLEKTTVIGVPEASKKREH